MIELTIEEGKDLDHLMYSIIKLPETHGSNVIELGVAHKYFLPNKGEYYTVEIIGKALLHQPHVIITNANHEQIGARTPVWPTPLINDFMKKGGFTRIAEQQEHEKKQREETEKLNLEKLKYDVRNSKRIFKTYWVTFGMALIGLIVSLILLILKIKTGK